MSELSMAMRIIEGASLYVHQNPALTWGFVGTVPAELIWDTDNPDQLRELASSNFPSMTRKALGVKLRLFQTREEAIAFARSRGFEPKG